jgi:hypothetical protein
MVSATLSPFLTFLSSSFPFSRVVLTCLTRYHFRCIQLSEDDASEIRESYFIFTRINYARLMHPISSGVCVSFMSGEDWQAYSE